VKLRREKNFIKYINLKKTKRIKEERRKKIPEHRGKEEEMRREKKIKK